MPNRSPDLRIVFAGTPAFAVPALLALADAGLAPHAVLTQPDRPAGRGRKLQASEVKTAALEHQLTVLQPESLRDTAVQRQLTDLRPDLMVVVAYGLILPAQVLAIPRYGCWNIHASLLPRWRGAAPIQRAVESGDSHTGVSIMQMALGLDTGPVFLQTGTRISEQDTGGSVHDRLAALGAAALMECIEHLSAGEMPVPRAQDEERVTYAAKLNKAEAELDWTQAAVDLQRKVRAFNPWPVCWCMLNGQRLRIWQAEAVPAQSPQVPGTVLQSGNQSLEVATANGNLRLLEVQRAGGRPVPITDFLRAQPAHP